MKIDRAPADAEARLRVGVIMLRDFTLLPFAGFIDVLRLATDDGDRSRQRACRWTVMSSGGQPARASCGTLVEVDADFRPPRDFDYIVVVGGLLHEQPQADEATDRYLLQAAAAGVPLIGLCTAVFTLIRLGLMSGRRCCVSWYHYWDLKSTFPEVTPIADHLFVVDGPRITCAGGTGAIDLAAWLVARHLGRAAADKALHILLAEGPRPPDAPQPHLVIERPARDPRLEHAVNFIEQNLAQPPHVEDVAARVGLSRRQLERIFRDEFGMSPWKYALGRRLRQAHLMLTQTEQSITEIAHQCGFADASHFSRHVRSTFGAPPQTVRDAALAADGGGEAQGKRGAGASRV
ncbi:MAG TPA: GlxA family transcriptional regulator [Woeseiaceae bacterium]|jgi:transcriptional regulator GlxA family with amidase domain|nr:GlxA family transcriptional regulator [Woeseiaceae bacterium]